MRRVREKPNEISRVAPDSRGPLHPSQAADPGRTSKRELREEAGPGNVRVTFTWSQCYRIKPGV